MAYKTGSFINEIMYHTINNVKPYVGMGATEILWSDRHAYEIVEVVDAKHLIARRMKVKNIGGFGDNEWEITSDVGGGTVRLTLYKDGWYMQNGRYKGSKFSLGMMDEYYDYSF